MVEYFFKNGIELQKINFAAQVFSSACVKILVSILILIKKQVS